jgi:hypothetical protein
VNKLDHNGHDPVEYLESCITLKVQKFSIEFELPVEVETNTRLRHYKDHIAGQVVCQLLHSVYGQKRPFDFDYTYPATWWEHFKQDCFPKWLLRRYPPKMKTKRISYDAYALFPEIPVTDNSIIRYRMVTRTE